MTKEDILRMAREAGWKDVPTVRLAFAGFDIERFANLIIAEERARACRIIYSNCISDNNAAEIAAKIKGSKT